MEHESKLLEAALKEETREERPSPLQPLLSTPQKPSISRDLSQVSKRSSFGRSSNHSASRRIVRPDLIDRILVSNAFDYLDSDRKGYVTLEDIKVKTTKICSNYSFRHFEIMMNKQDKLSIDGCTKILFVCFCCVCVCVCVCLFVCLFVCFLSLLLILSYFFESFFLQ